MSKLKGIISSLTDEEKKNLFREVAEELKGRNTAIELLMMFCTKNAVETNAQDMCIEIEYENLGKKGRIEYKLVDLEKE